MKTKYNSLTARSIMCALLTVSFSLFTFNCFSQGVSINNTGATASNSALLDVSNASKGALIPRVSLTSTTDVTTITSPANGLIVFNTNSAIGNGAGFYYYCSSGCGATGWMYISSANNGPGTSGQVLTSQGSGNAPQWTTTASATVTEAQSNTMTITTNSGQQIVVWAKGVTSSGGNQTMTLNQDGTTMDQVNAYENAASPGWAFGLMYTAVPGAGSHTITIGGGVNNPVIMVMKL